MYVNDLAKKVGVPVDTVRYYTRRQLLVPKICPENGYKIFSNDDVHRLQFISRAKQYRFTLSEIRSLLERIMAGDSACSSVRDLLKRHIKKWIQNRRIATNANQDGKSLDSLGLFTWWSSKWEGLVPPYWKQHPLVICPTPRPYIKSVTQHKLDRIWSDSLPSPALELSEV